MNSGNGTAKARTNPAPHGRNWDPVVKITHWLIAAAILLNVFLTEDGSGPHVWIGYAALGVLVIRLIWGLLGPKPARFASFPPNPAAAWRHLKQLIAGKPEEHRSHNPLGTLMVYALWASLAVVIATGISMEGLPPMGRPAATEPASDVTSPEASARHLYTDDNDDETGDDDGNNGRYAREHGESGAGEAEEWVEEVHEIAAWLLIILAAIHVTGVIVDSRISRINRARAMLFGKPE